MEHTEVDVAVSFEEIEHSGGKVNVIVEWWLETSIDCFEN